MELPDLVAKTVISACNSDSFKEREKGTLIQLVRKDMNSFAGKKSEVCSNWNNSPGCNCQSIMQKHCWGEIPFQQCEEMLGAWKPSLSISRQPRITRRYLRVESAKLATPTRTYQLRQMPLQGQEQYRITSPHMPIPLSWCYHPFLQIFRKLFQLVLSLNHCLN